MSPIQITSTAGGGPVHNGTVSISKVAMGGFLYLQATGHAGLKAAINSGTDYDHTAQEYTHIWTVRGSPLSPFVAPTNIVTGWNDPNVMYGQKVAFYLPNDGTTYTIDLWVVDRDGTTAIAETTETPATRDATYPGAQTICYSNDGGETWAGEKPGCQRITSNAALQAAINAATTNPVSILFKRGQDLSDIDLEFDTGDRVGDIGDWGSGADPILRPSSNDADIFRIRDMAESQITIRNLDFRGGWDATKETGIAHTGPVYYGLRASSLDIGFYGCKFDGFDQTGGDLLNYGDTIREWHVNEVNTNWRDYAYYTNPNGSANSLLAFIGVRYSQHVDALNGGPKDGAYNTHNCIRVSERKTVLMAICDFFTRAGWSTGGSTDTSDNPGLRLNTNCAADQYYSLERIVVEGGFRVIQASGQNTSGSFSAEVPGNYILDKVLLIATPRTFDELMHADFGGTQLRNVIGFRLNVPQYAGHGSNWAAAIDRIPDNPDPTNANGPVSIHGCTFISLQNGVNGSDDPWILQVGDGNYNTVDDANNVVYAPNIDTPVVGDATIDVSTAMPGVTPRFKGVRVNFEAENGTLSGNVANGASFTVPYSQITTDRYRETGGSVTDQTYWQAVTDTDHTLILQNPSNSQFMYSAELGDFTVAFEASVVRITNTSGGTWTSGWDWTLRLDRISNLPAMDATYDQTGATLPLPRPLTTPTNSPAIDGGDTGTRPFDDFLGDVRPGPWTHDHLGNAVPATGNERGALLTA